MDAISRITPVLGISAAIISRFGSHIPGFGSRTELSNDG